ncbi:MAG: site-2 protease family protein [Patescibacteria group bacterium]|nr:site-2 protease family protein [Patescibacteria group bacterium]
MFILVALLTINVIVAIHELGHLLAMRRYGVVIKEVSLGFGPKLFGWRSGSSRIQYSLRLLPLGGSAKPKMKGRGSLPRASRMDQLKIYLAGMLFNVMTASVLMVILMAVNPPAKCSMPEPIAPLVSWLPPMVACCLKGFAFPFFAWLATPVFAVHALFFGGGGVEVIGPVGVASMFKGYATMSFGAYMGSLALLIANISVALAAMNLLPIPPLDGGRIMVLGLEKLFGRVGTIIGQILTLLGVLALLVLIVYVSGIEIRQLIHS